MTVISAWWWSNMRFQKSSRVDVELSYNSVKTEVRQFEFQLEFGRSYRRDMVRKATSGRRGHWGPDGDWGPEKLLIRCSKESHHPAEWASGWASGEQERHNSDGHKSRGQNITVYVRSPNPSHTQTLSNPFRTLTNKVRGTHLFIKKSSCLRLYYCVVMML